MPGTTHQDGHQDGHHDGQTTDGLYLRQLLSGQDFALDDPVATQMVNFVYAIGDPGTRECVLIDPAYRPAEIIAAVGDDGYEVVGVLATHYHADHIGGSLFGHDIAGIAALLDEVDVPIHVQRDEVEWINKTTGVAGSQLVAHDGGDVVRVGSQEIQLIHTPGHTPGSQCFLVDGNLVSGDTLFLDGCGRTDLPGSDPGAMATSLRRLSTIDDSVTLYPGHRYSPAPSAPMGVVKASNWVFDALG